MKCVMEKNKALKIKEMLGEKKTSCSITPGELRITVLLSGLAVESQEKNKCKAPEAGLCLAWMILCPGL